MPELGAEVGELPSRAPRRRRSPSVILGVGLVLTAAGLLFLSDLLPSGSGALERALPIAATGLLALWLGGVLLGRGGRR